MSSPNCTVHRGDCLEVLKGMADGSVHCCVTSPPYWGLRSYLRNELPEKAREIGGEATPEEFVSNLTEVFREVRRVLRDDGTAWVNLGDSYSTNAGGFMGKNERRKSRSHTARLATKAPAGLPQKNLIGMPWRVAFALQADGWILRQDIIWSKPNPMPESVTDRCTKAHEYIFMFSKEPQYYYDAAAIRNPPSASLLEQVRDGYTGEASKDFTGNGVQDASATKSRIIAGARKRLDKQRGHSRRHAGFNERWDHLTHEEQAALGSNKRSVWTVATRGFKGAHFATFPPELVKPCILAGCPAGGTVLDVFGGSGTTGATALHLGRSAVLIELNPDYIPLIHERTAITPGLALA